MFGEADKRMFPAFALLFVTCKTMQNLFRHNEKSKIFRKQITRFYIFVIISNKESFLLPL